MKRIVKNGPQLTGAQVLDYILYVLDEWRRNADKKVSDTPDFDRIALGKWLAYDEVFDLVEIIRSEKFDDDQTENPFNVLGKSRSYGL